ncbi:MAG: HAD-IIB family hydrolase [Pseudomonadota bacterium]|nr:HAD-IIB family hydrolase [Pseudomonadota bacterium]
MKKQKIVVFTDLDATLLAHDDYSFAKAQNGLDLCRRLQIPVIAVTSKTQEETRLWVKRIELDQCFVFENGGGIHLEGGEIIKLGLDYSVLRQVLVKLSTSFPVRGFGDMGAKEIAERTGLSLKEANIAALRHFSEPFICPETNFEKLEQAVGIFGLQLVRGGRFFNLQAMEQSKGNAVAYLIERFKADFSRIFSIALGDSPNDFSMLSKVSCPWLVRHPEKEQAIPEIDNLKITSKIGSKGWSEAILETLNNL